VGASGVNQNRKPEPKGSAEMPEKAMQKPRPHTELRRQDKGAVDRTDQEAPKLKPRSPEDRLPGGDEDDLFNDMPV
jgi:hypothetical protein